MGVGVCGSMSVQQVSGVPWGWHRGAKMRFELEWGGSWDRASAERSAIAACRRRTRRGRDGRGRSRLRCHRHLFADFLGVAAETVTRVTSSLLVVVVTAAAEAAGSRWGVLVMAPSGSRRVWIGDPLSGAGVAVTVEPVVAAGVAAETVTRVTSSLLVVVVTAAAEAAGSRWGVLVMAPSGSRRVWIGDPLSGAGVAVTVEPVVAAEVAAETVTGVASSLSMVVVAAAAEARRGLGGGPVGVCWPWPRLGPGERGSVVLCRMRGWP